MATPRSEAPQCARCHQAIDLADREGFVSRPQGLRGRVYIHSACLTPDETEAVLETLR